jgi:C4-dicarboxylate-specific signal transduction histidine kinase
MRTKNIVPLLISVFREMDAKVLETGEENVNEESLSNLSIREVRTIVTRKTRYIGPTGKRFLVGVIRDITDHTRLATELGHARKLEAVGQLASGIAHEINTPTQYVGDGVPAPGRSIPVRRESDGE